MKKKRPKPRPKPYLSRSRAKVRYFLIGGILGCLPACRMSPDVRAFGTKVCEKKDTIVKVIDYAVTAANSVGILGMAPLGLPLEVATLPLKGLLEGVCAIVKASSVAAARALEGTLEGAQERVGILPPPDPTIHPTTAGGSPPASTPPQP